MSTPRRWLARVALTALSTALALGAVEVIARQLAPPDSFRLQEAEQRDAECLSPMDGPGYAWKPGACGANEQGFLGPAVETSPADGTLRIVLLGDSISGDGRYGRWTAELLSQALGRPVEVLNFGVFGYNPDNELGMWEALASRYNPHLVVHQFCVNDYQHTPVFYRQGGRLMSADNKNGQLQGVPIALYQRSALVRWAVGVRAVRQNRVSVAPFDERAQGVTVAMTALDTKLRQAGVPWVSLRFPYLAERDDWRPEDLQAETHFGALLAELGVPDIDLGPRYAAFGPDRLLQDSAPAELEALQSQGTLEGLSPQEAAEVLVSAKHYFPPIAPNGQVDRIHPNGFGHYLAARALTDWLAPRVDTLAPGLAPYVAPEKSAPRTRTPASR
ncbi:MAG: SGNH/GDSL hydrolase family protein [Myxococcota bacterium]|nr:SGNH/GDSL hydrolase family protein [Myxococcota bacterium]